MFGRVPFAFYVAHFYLLHALSVLLGVMQGIPVGAAHDLSAVLSAGLRRARLPGGVPACGAGRGLLLYPFCRWVAGVKARSRAWWLSYV